MKKPTQKETIEIAEAVISARKKQVAEHGDLFADELKYAQNRLEEIRKKWICPKTYIAIESHYTALQWARNQKK